MVARLIAVGLALFLAAGVFGAALYMLSPARAVTPPVYGASALVRSLNQAVRESADTERLGWVVTKAQSAHHMLVVEVEAERLEQARSIAIQVVEPVLAHGYDEILVYVQEPGRVQDHTMRRIQWTPSGGYVETSFPDR